MNSLAEDSLKSTRNLHRAIITISVVSLVFAFSLRRPAKELSIKSALESLLDYPFLEYDIFAQAKIDQYSAQHLEPIGKQFSERLESKGHMIFSQNHIGDKLAQAIEVGKFTASDTILTDLSTSTLTQLAQLSPILETHRNIQILLPQSDPLLEQVDRFLYENPITGAKIENIRIEVDIEDLANPHFVGEKVLCSLYFELRQVGIITAAPTFNATFEATVKEIENTSFNLWLKSRQEATSLVDSTGKELKWLPRLTELNREERNTKIGELLANVTETIEEVGPNKQTVSFLGTTIPGILIIIATPVTLLFLQYYFSNHLSHLANSKISDRDSFPQFAWMPMSLRSKASTLELLWTIAFLPIATLIVLWVQVAKFEALDWFPSIIIIAAILGISAFSWKSHKCLKKLRTSIESVSAQVQESQSKVAIEKLDHVALDVMDVDKAASFYGVLLGLKEIARPESFDFPGLWYELGNTVLHIVGPRQPSLGAHHIAFWVNDVHACAETVREAGFQVEWDSYKIVGVDRFFTADPEGNRIEIQGTERNLEAYTGP